MSYYMFIRIICIDYKLEAYLSSVSSYTTIRQQNSSSIKIGDLYQIYPDGKIVLIMINAAKIHKTNPWRENS